MEEPELVWDLQAELGEGAELNELVRVALKRAAG